MPTVPARTANVAVDGAKQSDLVWFETIGGGGYTTKLVARGTRVRLTDIDGDACAHCALFLAPTPHERLCIADTVKAQWDAYAASGTLLLSDQGRVLASMVGDTSGHHDTMAGPSTRLGNEARYGSGSVEGPSPAGRELLLLGAAKHGLGPRDIPPTISFFQGVTVALDGELCFEGSAGPGATVEFLAELPLILLFANAPHPIDPRPSYICSPLQIVAWRSRPTTPDDARWSATPEGERAFASTLDLLEAAGWT